MASGTILEKRELTTVPETGYLYIVYNDGDFKATVGALIQLVTKARIGLGNVDNTSDADKPISNVASTRFTALEQSIQTTAAQLRGVITGLEGYVSLEHLNQIVSDLQAGLEARPTEERALELISTALLSVGNEIAALETRVAEVETQLQDFQTSLNQLVQSAVSDGILSVDAALTSRMEAFEESVNQALSNKADSGHTHVSADIVDLGKYVRQSLRDEGVVVVGPRTW